MAGRPLQSPYIALSQSPISPVSQNEENCDTATGCNENPRNLIGATQTSLQGGGACFIHRHYGRSTAQEPSYLVDFGAKLDYGMAEVVMSERW